MSDDQVRIEETQLWLIKARRDLTAAVVLMQSQPPLYDAAAYHCQQAGEKALKGFLVWYDRPFGKIHDLESLLRQAALIEPILNQFRQEAQLLTPLATQYRYPGAEDMAPSEEVVQVAVEAAADIIAAILQLLPQIRVEA